MNTRLSTYGYFWSDFERYKILIICLWNPKQQRRPKKSSKVAVFATNLILACFGIRLQCTVWPRNDVTFIMRPSRPKLGVSALSTKFCFELSDQDKSLLWNIIALVCCKKN